MQVYVYRSARREGAYLYLAERDRFDCLPETLAQSLAPFEFALELALTPERKLAREDSRQVLANLGSQGFHLQLPPPQVFEGFDGQD